jgi:uncharacterized protein (DUF1800 family)
MSARLARSLMVLLVCVSLVLPSVSFAQDAPQKSSASPRAGDTAGKLSERQRVVHALNRLTFGPRPGDVDAVLAKGLDSWIEDQLHPESLDDSALNGRMAPYATTRMSLKQMADLFPSDNVINQIVSGKRALPPDPVQKMVYSVQVARIEQDKAKQAAASASAMAESAAMSAASAKADASSARSEMGMAKPEMARPEADKAAGVPDISPQQEAAREIADHLLDLPKDQRMAALENVAPEKLVDFPAQLRADQRDHLLADFTPDEREIFRALAIPRNVVANELQQAKVTREIYSERQLQEVMTDFWVNHFNVFQYKDQCVYYTTAFERDTIRPHAFGKFYDLLVATAQSPAMLVFLDNWVSMGPHSQAAGKGGFSGLNENYGRELMELHTLGVDGGYTQSDVTELARVLTGWTIAQPEDGAKFQFDPRRHEPGVKTVLDQKFYEAGMDEGLRALYAIAHNPATGHFISKSIAMRFISDDPPESVVKRMTDTFLSTDGDIREVMRTMLKSPEFWSPKVYRAKFKTPLEFVVSAVRASGANVTVSDSLVQNLNAMGMRPYGMESPAGYSMKEQTWQTEGAVLARINFSTALTQNKLAGVQFEPGNLVTLGLLTASAPPQVDAKAPHSARADVAMELIETTLLNGDLSARDKEVIHKQMQDPQVQRQLAAAPLEGLRQVVSFVLASPDFQMR